MVVPRRWEAYIIMQWGKKKKNQKIELVWERRNIVLQPQILSINKGGKNMLLQSSYKEQKTIC